MLSAILEEATILQRPICDFPAFFHPTLYIYNLKMPDSGITLENL